MNNEDLADLMRAVPDPTMLVDATATIVWVNERAEKVFRRSLDDVVGMSALDFVHPDDLSLVLLGLADDSEEALDRPVELRVRANDDWLLVEAVGTRRPDGMIMLSLRDITERRLYEVSRDGDARFRSLVHNAAAITMLLDPAGVITSASGAMTRVLGHDSAAIQGLPFAALATADYQADLERTVLETQHGKPSTMRAHFPTRDGDQVIPMAIHTVNLLDDPTVNGYVLTAHDVTHQVATETELHAALSLLTATLESTADGILVVDRHNRITNFNQQFVDMWRIPDSVIESGDDEIAIDFVLDQLSDPEAFVTKVTELYSDPSASSYDTLEFKDGRIFERFSRPQKVDGEVHGRVWSFRDLTERKRLEDELVYRAFHDQLTGLPNKARFCDRLQHVTDRAQRSDTGFAVLFCDLDNFKTVNDSLGHQAGDDLLVSAANTLTECLRVGDTAARLGGDEFAVLIQDLGDPNDALALAERITQSFRRQFRIGIRDVSSTVSVGIAFGGNGTTSDQLLRNADLAMYMAKERGKDRYECFEDQQHEAAVVRVELDADLRCAVERDELILFYQPMVNLMSERIVAVEALVRWNHPERGLLLPGAFIPIAEEVGLMDTIGSMVLEQACAAAAIWHGEGVRGVAVSVNVSPRQLTGNRLVSDVARALDSSGISPSSLILEITETAMLQDTEAARRNLDAVKAMGVTLALDDFGTGFSSLTHLQQFPIDIVKIDKSFVARIHEPGSGSLAPAVIQLAVSLGLTTVAEGVENVPQLRRLRELNCDLVQGFLLHRPQPASHLCELLSDRSRETDRLHVA